MIKNFKERIVKCVSIAEFLGIKTQVKLVGKELVVTFNNCYDVEEFSGNFTDWELEAFEIELAEKLKKQQEKDLRVKETRALWETLPEKSRQLIKENISYLI